MKTYEIVKPFNVKPNTRPGAKWEVLKYYEGILSLSEAADKINDLNNGGLKGMSFVKKRIKEGCLREVEITPTNAEHWDDVVRVLKEDLQTSVDDLESGKLSENDFLIKFPWISKYADGLITYGDKDILDEGGYILTPAGRELSPREGTRRKAMWEIICRNAGKPEGLSCARNEIRDTIINGTPGDFRAVSWAIRSGYIRVR